MLLEQSHSGSFWMVSIHGFVGLPWFATYSRMLDQS